MQTLQLLLYSNSKIKNIEKLNNPLEQNLNQLNIDKLKRLEQQLEICKNAVQNRKFEKICSELYNELKFDILNKITK